MNIHELKQDLTSSQATISDNKNYGDIVIPSSDLNTLRIIDRVVWSGHLMI